MGGTSKERTAHRDSSNLSRDKGTRINIYRTTAYRRTEPELPESHQNCLVHMKTNFSSFLGMVRFIPGRVKAHSNAGAE